MEDLHGHILSLSDPDDMEDFLMRENAEQLKQLAKERARLEELIKGFLSEFDTVYVDIIVM